MTDRTLTVDLDGFNPRPYQLDFIRAFEDEGYKRLIVVWPRRSGKDYTSIEILLRAALKRVATYYIVYPTYGQGRRIFWDGIDNGGKRFRDKIPPQLIAKSSEQHMRITLVNNSQLQVIGSKTIDNIVGVNLGGVIFSEYALQSPLAYQLLRPVIVANDAFEIFISTPRGKNSFYDLFKIAQNHPDWWVSHLSVEDTKHIAPEIIQKEVEDGIMSWDLCRQEYFCDFSIGAQGAYYSRYMDAAYVDERITRVPYDASLPVHTAWDIGIRDSSVILFFQVFQTTVRIIDYYENNKQGLEHYAKVLAEKAYNYGTHIAPHDIQVTEFGSGMTRLEKARQLGIRFKVAPQLSIEDGIEAVRSLFGRVWIDEKHCAPLIKALENYRQEWDDKKQVYKPHPLHDKYSHAADAMRYLAVALPKTQDGLTQADIDKKFMEKRYGYDLPREFIQPRY